ncbi:TetR/AcrR family transcriptional regulator [Nocardioides massiliensis]|uniref:AcrR family transcriptional regulator n=1 Tax=Nocardioides massiliensis TaxID=1325935 RepID=A0ABT9NNJ0_9ACTN|nr:TetR/AcrR family transcriptional regulator [Nocardioides massiliensis]MDP9821822.1 AcrR family transcriptional regulator [Nocardioides massiliensis]
MSDAMDQITSQPRGNGSRDRALNAEMIARQALTLADEGGLEKLTVRSLANALGIGTMTFYGYFRSKEEILDAMADEALGSLQLPEGPPDESPRQAIESVASAFRGLMRDHPSIAQILSSRVTTSQRARRGAMEVVIDRLMRSGIPGPLAVKSYGFLMIYALGFAGYQAVRPWGSDGAPADEVDESELRRQQRHYYAALPRAEFPRLVELRDELIELPGEEQFRFGVSCLCDIVEATLDISSPS